MIDNTYLSGGKMCAALYQQHPGLDKPEKFHANTANQKHPGTA